MSPKIYAFLFPLVCGFLPAQTLTVPNPIAAGDVIMVGYSDPAKAGQTITVTVDDGSLPLPNKSTITIQLDQSGNGSKAWVVPAWLLAKFNAPGVTEVVRFL